MSESTSPTAVIRRATPADVDAVTRLIYELAEYEKARHECTVVPEQLAAALFGPEPAVFAHVVEVPTPEGPTVVGTAIWFRNFSTWDGVHGIYLEDLYVTPEHRVPATARRCWRRSPRSA